ncbi:MAG: AAA family ATPase [Actinomycetota bacterium]|nr:AAA family ATPase [Actinomycetota bacterium]
MESLIERSDELRQLEGVLRASASGRGVLVAVSGEAGIGKSRLIGELCARARESGFLIMTGSCWPDGGSTPFGPWVDALAGSGPTDLREVADLLRQDVGSGASTSGSVAGLLDVVDGVVARAAEAHPLLVCIEDIHWADPSSLRLASFLARAVARRPMVLVLTYRTEAAVGSPVASQILELCGRPEATRIDLGGLSVEGLRSMIELVAPSFGGDAPRLAAHTGGNPFFVLETLRLVEGAFGAAGDLPLPRTVADTIERRLGWLEPDDRRILEAVAVLGNHADRDVVADMIGGPVPDAAIARLVAVRILRAPHEEVYRFEHDLTRHVVVDSIEPDRRAALHRQASRVLARHRDAGAAISAAAVAQHRIDSGAPPDEALVELLSEAARAAFATCGYEEAATQHRLVIDLATREDALHHHIGPALVGAAESLKRLGRRDEARRLTERVLRLARRNGDHDLLAEGAILAFESHTTVDAGQLQLLEEAAAVRPPSEDATTVHLLGALSSAVYYEDRARAIDLAAQGLDIARRLDDDVSLVLALQYRNFSIWGADELDELEANGRTMVDLGRRTRHPTYQAFGYHALLSAAAMRGDFRTMDTMLASLTDVADLTGEPRHRSFAAQFAAMSAVVRGELDIAAASIDRATKLAGEAADALALDGALSGTFLLSWLRGELDLVESEVIEQADNNPLMRAWQVGLLFTSARVGHEEKIRDPFEQLAAADFADFDRNAMWLGQMAMLTKPAALLGDRRRGRILHELLVPYADTFPVVGHSVSLGSAYRALAAASLAAGEPVRAVEELHVAGERDRAAGARMWLAHDHAFLAQVELAAGHLAEATEAAASALDLARRLGLRRLVGEVEEVLEHATSSVALPADLSGREVEVLRALAGGATNREIGDALYISVKTVERHLSNVYAKIGAKNRVEAAAFARRHRLDATGPPTGG